MKKLFLLLFLCLFGISKSLAQSYIIVNNGNSKTIVDLVDVTEIAFEPVGFYACGYMDGLFFNHPQNSGITSCPIRLSRISGDSIALNDICCAVNQMGKTSWIGQNILRGRVGITDKGYCISCSPYQEVGDGKLVFAGYDLTTKKFSTSTDIVFYISKDYQTLTSDGFGVCDAKTGQFYSKYQGFSCNIATGDKLYAHEKLNGLSFQYGLTKLIHTAGDSIAINNVSLDLFKMGLFSGNGQNILCGRVGVAGNKYTITCAPYQEVGDGNLVFVGYDKASNTYSTTKDIIFYVSSDLKSLTSDGFAIYDKRTGKYQTKYQDYSCDDEMGQQEQSYWSFATAADADKYLPYRATLGATHSSAKPFMTCNMINLYGQEFYGVASSVFDPEILFNQLSGSLTTYGVMNAAGFKMDLTGMFLPKVWFDATMIQMYFGENDYPGHFDVYVSKKPIESAEDLQYAVKIGSSKSDNLYVTNQQTSSDNPMKFNIPMEYWGETYVYIVNTSDYNGDFSGEKNFGIVVFGYGVEVTIPEN